MAGAIAPEAEDLQVRGLLEWAALNDDGFYSPPQSLNVKAMEQAGLVVCDEPDLYPYPHFVLTVLGQETYRKSLR